MGDGLVREIGSIIYFSFYLVADLPIPAMLFAPIQAPNEHHQCPMESRVDSTIGVGL
jgi:hypothetical protein